MYEIFDEDKRLNSSKAKRVEFLTTVKYIEKYLECGSKILDLGAGAGEYSLHLAQKGFEVTAVELSERNIESFRKKLQPEYKINLMQGNACDLSAFADSSFDMVLLLGPLYHLADAEERNKCIQEAKRVCKTGGMIFSAFISNDMVILTELFCYNKDYFKGNTYDHESFKVGDFPFVFFTVEQARQMLLDEGINIIHEVAADGVSELLAEKINDLDDESYNQYLNYHFYCCEKPEMLGRSSHLLFVARKMG